MTASIEFYCCDCGRGVVAFGYHIPMERCNVCAWIMQSVPLEQRAIVRERLGVTLHTTPAPNRTAPNTSRQGSKPSRAGSTQQNNKKQNNNGGIAE
jgi:hypothetical protein